jgi:hypothetical protein
MGNILAALPEIYAPTHERHWGVHESAFFSHLVRYCNHGRTDADLRAIKCLFEGSDFFALTGLAKGPEIVGHGPARYFRDIMEAGARTKGARYWLEKTPAHTLHAKFLAQAYPDAIFIAVVRNDREVVASNVHGFGKPSSVRCWFSHSLVTALYEKIIAASGVTVIRYENLATRYEETVRALLASLGVDCATVPRSAFGRNTLYRDAPPVIEWWQRAAAAAGRWLVLPLPGRLVEWAVTRALGRRPKSLPAWFFDRDRETRSRTG